MKGLYRARVKVSLTIYTQKEPKRNPKVSTPTALDDKAREDKWVNPRGVVSVFPIKTIPNCLCSFAMQVYILLGYSNTRCGHVLV